MIKRLSASGAVLPTGRKGYLYSINLVPSAAAAAAVVGTGTTGATAMNSAQAVANGFTIQSIFPMGVFYPDGIYVTLAGAGAVVEIEFLE